MEHIIYKIITICCGFDSRGREQRAVGSSPLDQFDRKRVGGMAAEVPSFTEPVILYRDRSVLECAECYLSMR